MSTREPTVKAIEVLCHIIEHSLDDVTARQIAAETGLPTTTAHRVLTTLAATGLLEYDDEQRAYRLGAMLHRIARLVTGSCPISELAGRYIQQLTNDTGESAVVGEYDYHRGELRFVAQSHGNHLLRYVVPLRTWLPVYVGASGLAIMAYLPADEQDGLVARAAAAGVDERTLRRQLAEVRDQGYAISFSARMEGAVGIAVPLIGHDETVAGDVVLTIPEPRFDAARTAEYVAAVSATAGQLSSAIGGPRAPTFAARPASVERAIS